MTQNEDVTTTMAEAFKNATLKSEVARGRTREPLQPYERQIIMDFSKLGHLPTQEDIDRVLPGRKKFTIWSEINSLQRRGLYPYKQPRKKPSIPHDAKVAWGHKAKANDNHSKRLKERWSPEEKHALISLCNASDLLPSDEALQYAIPSRHVIAIKAMISNLRKEGFIGYPTKIRTKHGKIVERRIDGAAHARRLARIQRRKKRQNKALKALHNAAPVQKRKYTKRDKVVSIARIKREVEGSQSKWHDNDIAFYIALCLIALVAMTFIVMHNK